MLSFKSERLEQITEFNQKFKQKNNKIQTIRLHQDNLTQSIKDSEELGHSIPRHVDEIVQAAKMS